MDNKDKFMMLLVMEEIYVHDFKDISKIGFVKDQMEADVLTNNNAFERILSKFRKDCLNNNKLSYESKTILSVYGITVQVI